MGRGLAETCIVDDFGFQRAIVSVGVVEKRFLIEQSGSGDIKALLAAVGVAIVGQYGLRGLAPTWVADVGRASEIAVDIVRVDLRLAASR